MTLPTHRGPSLGRRLNLAFGATLLLALAGSGFGAWTLNDSAERTRELIDTSVVTERMVSDWYRGVAVSVRRTTAVAVSTDPTLSDFFAPEAAAANKSTSELQNRVSELMSRDEEKRLFAEIGEVRKSFLAARNAVFELKKAGDAVGSRKTLDDRYVPAATKYQEALQQLATLERQKIDDEGRAVQAANRSARLLLLAFGFGSLITGGLLSAWLARSITRPIQRAVDVANRIAGLDLTEKIESHDRDETGRLLKTLDSMQSSLKSLVTQVRLSTDGIGTASTEIADGNMDLSSRTEQAAASLQQTAASMDQMAGSVQQTVHGARTARELATAAAEVATRGGELVARVVSTMEEINGSSSKIADIIGVIDGIAFQTNILALNAAGEAAAAREIKSLIGASVGKVELGTQLVADAGVTMNDVVESASRVAVMITELSTAAAEQSKGIGQVNTAMAQLDQVTQQNAALVEESAAAAESLKLQARQLGATVQRFRVDA
jgi:methyl-accepting chemotaxis protein